MRPELPRQGGDLTQMPPTPIIPQQLGTVGAGRRVVLCPVSLSPHRSSHRKGTTNPPTQCGRSQVGATEPGPPLYPEGTWGAAGLESCSMLTAGQRCYSGPAAGWGLADRVSLSNASHAPTKGGGHHHQAVLTASPRHLSLRHLLHLGDTGDGWMAGGGKAIPSPPTLFHPERGSAPPGCSCCSRSRGTAPHVLRDVEG